MLLEEREDLIKIMGQDLQKITENLEDLIKTNPNDARAHCALGALYLQSGKKRSAVEQECEKAIELNPSLADAYFYLGEVDYLNSKYSKNKEKLIEKAIRNYEKAISIEPSFKIANYKLGRIHFEDKNFDKAIDRFEVITPQVEKLFDKNKISNFLLHPFYRITRVYPKIEKNAPPDIISKKEEYLTFRNVYHFLALSYKNKGIMNKAKELTKKKVELSFCTKKEAIFYLGCVHYEFEDYEEAIKEWEKINPIEKKIGLDILGKGCPVHVDSNWVEDWVIREIYDLDVKGVIFKDDDWDWKINLETCINDAKKKLKTKNNSF